MRKLAAYLLMMSVSPLALYAQDAQTVSSDKSPQAKKDAAGVVFLDEIILNSENRAAGSGYVTRVESEQINRAQATTLVDVISDVPGVNAIHRGSLLTAQPSIRGFGGNHHYPGDPATNVSVDGVNTEGGRVYQNATGMIADPALMKSVTVAMGPLSSLEYGSGISAGSIAVETINGSDLTGDNVGFKFRQMLGANSNGKGWVTSSSLAWQPNQKFDFLLNYTRRAQGEMKNGDGKLLGQRGFNVPSYLLKARYRINDEQAVTLSYNKFDSAERNVPYSTMMDSVAFGYVDRDRSGTITSLSWNYKPADNPYIDMELKASRSKQLSDVRSLDPVSTPPKYSRTAEGQYDTTTDRITLKNTSIFNTGDIEHRLRFGLDWSQQHLLRTPFANGANATYKNARYTRFGVFAINNMSFGNEWEASLGLRLERQHITDTTGGDYHATARTLGAGLEKGFGNGLTLLGSVTYTEGLPSLDVYSSTSKQGGVNGDKVQKSRTYELGVKYDGFDVFQSGDDLTLGLTAYKTAIWNPMYSASSATIGYDLQGVELSANYTMENGFYARGVIDIVHHTETSVNNSGVVTKADYSYQPGNQLGLTVGKTFNNGVTASWHMRAGEGVYSASRQNPGWAVHDLKVSFAPQSGVFEGAVIDLGVDNVFDRKYNSPLSRLDEPGRNFKFNISRTF